jgi:hypothetical protein
MSTLSIHVTTPFAGVPDARGDKRIYAAGWVGETDEETAGFAVAMGFAAPVGDWPEAAVAGVATLARIVAEFRAFGIEPTQRDVYRAVEVMAREARRAAEAGHDTPVASDPAAAATSAAAAAAGAPRAPRRRR